MTIKNIKLYTYYNFLFWHYVVLEMSTHEIGKICGVKGATINYWLRKFNIPVRTRSEVNKGRKHTKKTKQKIREANLGKKFSDKTKRKLSEVMKGKNKGKNNGNWKENYGNLGYGQKHTRMKKRLTKMGTPKPDICPICKIPRIKKNIHLMNIDHEYRDVPDEWFYMCSKCHEKKYDFLAGLKQGKTKPIPNLIKNLLNLKTRIERKQLLKGVILNV